MNQIISNKEIRDSNGRFLPGRSGNPIGRTKSDVTIKELARQHTEKAIQTLVEVIQDETASHSARVHAASAILDRGWGKPAQYIESVNASMDIFDYLASLPEPTADELADVQTVVNIAHQGNTKIAREMVMLSV